MFTCARSGMAVTRSMARNLISAPSTELVLTNSSAENAFLMKIDAKHASVSYQKEGNVYHLTHSSVPDELQGKGYGKILAKKTFDYIVNTNSKMKISCDFLMDYYQKNRDKYKQHVV